MGLWEEKGGGHGSCLGQNEKNKGADWMKSKVWEGDEGKDPLVRKKGIEWNERGKEGK